MQKRQGKNSKRQAVRKQQLRDEADAKRAKGPPLPPSPPLSALPRGALDLHVVFDLCIVSDATDEVTSGEHSMGDHPPEAASLGVLTQKCMFSVSIKALIRSTPRPCPTMC